ncbi:MULTISPECIES: ProQ/FINO family protein [unclassified Halomonas]|uniref:ProQ/FINO family protein n=1 Tax=Halomonas sp. N3-2A TaxID=2014541 RepID=UPI000B5B425F|nr:MULTISPECIES: ProQ/FINO family protein [unclassified Halomonas]ASK17980.1 ABC transporter substrate-binding protein [Halomonas sp. N3-2A]UTD55557.1 ProQ/FINO family protein [Halomonas sp. MS1]
MAAPVLDLLETLETHLEQTKAALNALREENEMLKRQLASQVPQTQPPSQPLQGPAQCDAPAAEPSAADVKPSDSQVISETRAAETAPQPPSPQALLNQWYKRYPHAFFTGHTKPLKVGIHQDLAQREPWSGKLIRRALANYVNLPRYVKSMREGAERIDLDGNPAGKVDKEAARHASDRRKDKSDSNASKQAPSSDHRKPQQSSGQASKQTSRQAPGDAVPTPVKAHEQRGEGEKAEAFETTKSLSLEDKLRGLQQKFTGR